MAETLSTIAQQLWFDLGQTEIFTATGGSATTVANSKWGNLDNPPDETRFKNHYIFVKRDAGGAGASPEGRYGQITAYNSTTYTLTIDTVTDAIASGDVCMFVKIKQFALMDVFEAINRGLRELGFLLSEDVSLTTAAQQTEYTIPAALRGHPLRDVQIETVLGDSDNNQYVSISGWNQMDLTTLYIPQQDAGRTLRLVGWGQHAELTAYNSALSSYVTKDLAVAAGKCALLERYLNNAADDAEKHWRTMYAEAVQQRETLKVTLPIYKPTNKRRRLFWSGTGDNDEREVPAPFVP